MHKKLPPHSMEVKIDRLISLNQGQGRGLRYVFDIGDDSLMVHQGQCLQMVSEGCMPSQKPENCVFLKQ